MELLKETKLLFLCYNVIKCRKVWSIMLRFIVCEDNKDFLGRLCNSVNKVMMPYNFEYKINKFTTYSKEVGELIRIEQIDWLKKNSKKYWKEKEI